MIFYRYLYLSFLFLILASMELFGEYDDILLPYFSCESANEDLLKKYKKEKNIKYDSWLGLGRDCLSYYDNKEKPIYGIYYFGNNLIENSLYSRMFLENVDTTVRNCKKLKLEALELYDAKLLTTDFKELCKIDSLKVLGLPVTGVRFHKEMEMPSELEVLVVRNSMLDNAFFEVIDRCQTLKKLVIKNCVLDFRPHRP